MVEGCLYGSIFSATTIFITKNEIYNQMEMIDSPTNACYLFSTKVFRLQLYLKCLVVVFISFSLFLCSSRREKSIFDRSWKSNVIVLELKDLRDVSICTEWTNLKSCRWSRLKVHVSFFAIVMRRIPVSDSHDANKINISELILHPLCPWLDIAWRLFVISLKI